MILFSNNVFLFLNLISVQWLSLLLHPSQHLHLQHVETSSSLSRARRHVGALMWFLTRASHPGSSFELSAQRLFRMRQKMGQLSGTDLLYKLGQKIISALLGKIKSSAGRERLQSEMLSPGSHFIHTRVWNGFICCVESHYTPLYTTVTWPSLPLSHPPESHQLQAKWHCSRVLWHICEVSLYVPIMSRSNYEILVRTLCSSHDAAGQTSICSGLPNVDVTSGMIYYFINLYLTR